MAISISRALAGDPKSTEQEAENTSQSPRNILTYLAEQEAARQRATEAKKELYRNRINEQRDDDLVDNGSLVIGQNLSLILNIESEYRQDENIFPDVICHEVVATDNIKLSDNYISPINFFNIKKSYLLNKQETIGKRFFVNIENSALNRQTYYSKLEESFNDTNFIYDTINLSFDKVDRLGKEKNIANNVHDFFVDNTFTKIGSYYKKITQKYSDLNNTSIEENLDFEEEDVIFESGETTRLKKIYNSVLRMPVIESGASRALNSDKMIGQLISNTSFSFNNIYPDAWSIDLLDSIANTSYDFLSLEGFEKYPVIKLKPLLSLNEVYQNDNSLNESVNYDSFNVTLTDALTFNDVKLSNKKNSLIFPYLNPIKNIVSSEEENENYYNTSLLEEWSIENSPYEKTMVASNSFDLFLVDSKIALCKTDPSRLSSDNAINFKTANNTIYKIEDTNERFSITEKLLFYNDKTNPVQPIGRAVAKGIKTSIPTLLNISTFNKINIVVNEENNEDFRSIYFDHKSTIYNPGSLTGAPVTDFLSCPSFTYFNTGSLKKTNDGFSYDVDAIKIIAWISNKTLFSGNRRMQQTSKKILGSPIFKAIPYYRNENIGRYVFTNNENAFHIKYYDDNKALLTDKTLSIKMLKEEDQSVGFRLDKLTRNNFSSYRNNKQQAFVVVRNTNKLHKINEMKEKFVNRDPKLQSSEEFFSNRVLIEQNSLKDTTNFPFRNNMYSGIENGKLTFKKSIKDIDFYVFDIQNEWSTYAVRLKRILNNIKTFKLKLESLEGKKVIDYFEKYKNKVKEISNYNFEGRLPGQNNFALVYGNRSVSFDSLDNSEFIISSNDKKFSKNNFNISSNSVKPITEYSLEDETDLNQIQFNITPSQYRSFINNYYPNSIIKNESSYLEKINESVSMSLDSDINKEHLGFTKLLSDAISKSESVDLIKTIVYFTLLEKNNQIIRSDNNFNTANGQLRNSYRKYLEEVFDYENFKNQLSYTVRTLNEWNMRSVSATDDIDSYIKEDFARDNDNQLINTAGLGLIGGEIYQFMFPFIKHKVRISNNIGEIQTFKANRLKRTGNRFIRGDEGWFIRSSNKAFFNFINHKSFNYDCYFNDEETNITKTQESNTVFNFSDESSKVSYIVLKDNFAKKRYDSESVQGPSLEKQYLVPRKDYFDDEKVLQRYDNLSEALNYTKSEEKTLKDYFNRSDIVFIQKIKDFIYSVLTYYNQSNFPDQASIINFVNNNDSILNLVLEFIKPLAETYSFAYDQIIDESFKKNLTKITEYQEGAQDTTSITGDEGTAPFTIIGTGTYGGDDGSQPGNDYVELGGKIRGNSSVQLDDVMFWDPSVVGDFKVSFLSFSSPAADSSPATDYTYARLAAGLAPVTSFSTITQLQSEEETADETDFVVVDAALSINSSLAVVDAALSINSSPIRKKFREDLIKVKNTLINTNQLEGLSHDILHYWLHQSENLNIQNIADEIRQSLREVESLLQDISNGLPDEASFLRYLSNKSKINKISKYASNRYFYQDNAFKNINSQQGILNLEDSFNEDNIFKTNLLNEDLSRQMASNTSYNLERSNFDILRFGINYELAEALSNNKFMHIKINIVSHKYPDVYFKPLNYFYTPIFTNLLPMHYKLLKDNLSQSNVDVKNYIGFYNYNIKNLDKRFEIFTKNEALSVIESLVQSSNFENSIYEIQEDAIRSSSSLYDKIYNDISESNNIKYIDYIKQKVFNEKDLGEEDITSLNVLSETVTSLFNNTSDNDFIKVFGKEKSDMIELLDIENNVIDAQSKIEIIDKKMYAYDFFSLLDKNISMTEFAKIFIDDIYYDIFNIKITREDILRRIDRDLFSSDYRGDSSYGEFVDKLRNEKEENSSYSFVIEAKIL